MKNQILLILVGFLIISCNKNPNSATDISTVKGRLLDASNSKPITGGKVYLTDGASWILADSAITGADSSYQFQYNNNKYPYTEIWATAKNYLPNENIANWAAEYPKPASGRQSVQDDGYGEINYVDIRLPPIGFVKYHFKQVHHFAGNTEIRFTP